MKASSGRVLFGLLLGLAGGAGFGLAARLAVQPFLRTEYNGYYADSGSGWPVLGMFLIGWVTGVLVPLVNRALVPPLVGAGVWALGEAVFLCLPFAYSSLLIPLPVLAACGLLTCWPGRRSEASPPGSICPSRKGRLGRYKVT